MARQNEACRNIGGNIQPVLEVEVLHSSLPIHGLQFYWIRLGARQNESCHANIEPPGPAPLLSPPVPEPQP